MGAGWSARAEAQKSILTATASDDRCIRMEETPEMVERVARASFAHWRENRNRLGVHMDRGQSFEDMSEGEMGFALAHARSVILAMREPSDAMCEAAGATYEPHACVDCFGVQWRAAIDAALGR